MPAEPTSPRPVLRCVDAREDLGAGTEGQVSRSVGAIGIPVLRTDDGPVIADGVPGQLRAGGDTVEAILDGTLCAQSAFSGHQGQTLTVSAPGRPSIIFVGCGEPDRISSDAIRSASACFVRAAGTSDAAAFVLPAGLVGHLGTSGSDGHGAAPAPRRAAQAVAEGALLAGYRFVTHKSSAEERWLACFIVAGAGLEHEVVVEGVRRGEVTARAVCFARDLVNEPPSSMAPRQLAAAAQGRLSGLVGVALDVWDEDRIAQERLGGLLGVARGSAEPPRLLWATYEPPDPVQVDGRVPHVVLVGKGITFDSGGLSLKTPEGMTTMKTDMSGAAAVIATLGACGDLGVRIKVTAIAPVTENMPGGKATKPGDVLTIRDGQTIEVLNTDAEGRLVLADGLSLAAEQSPDAIVDLATLTGACIVALGSGIAGLFGNDDSLVERVGAASDRAGERTWALPLASEYKSHIDSDVADMKNIGKAGQAGAIAAALLLERFTKGIPWVHLDIAGPARSDEDDGITTKGATGFGVRTLLELVERFGAD